MTEVRRRHERSGVPAARSRDSIAFAIAGG
jgi:hypothetical protein